MQHIKKPKPINPIPSLMFFCFIFFNCIFYSNLTYNTRYSIYNTLLVVTYLQYTSQYSQYITCNNLLLLSIHVTLLTINSLQEIIYNTMLHLTGKNTN